MGTVVQQFKHNTGQIALGSSRRLRGGHEGSHLVAPRFGAVQ